MKALKMLTALAHPTSVAELHAYLSKLHSYSKKLS